MGWLGDGSTEGRFARPERRWGCRRGTLRRVMTKKVLWYGVHHSVCHLEFESFWVLVSVRIVVRHHGLSKFENFYIWPALLSGFASSYQISRKSNRVMVQNDVFTIASVCHREFKKLNFGQITFIIVKICQISSFFTKILRYWFSY